MLYSNEKRKVSLKLWSFGFLVNFYLNFRNIGKSLIWVKLENFYIMTGMGSMFLYKFEYEESENNFSFFLQLAPIAHFGP
jgi:hypothetical protein